MVYKYNMILDEFLTDKFIVVFILSDPFCWSTVTLRSTKMQVSKGPIIHYLNNFLLSQLYGMQIIQSIRIYPCKNYNRTWSVYLIFISSYSAAFGVFV